MPMNRPGHSPPCRSSNTIRAPRQAWRIPSSIAGSPERRAGCWWQWAPRSCWSAEPPRSTSAGPPGAVPYRTCASASDEVAPPIDRTASASGAAHAGASAAAVTPAPAAAASPSSAAGTPAPLSVTVSARRRAWVRLGTDGTSSTSGFLQAGDKRVLTATREVNIHSGDAGALLVSVNGAPAAPFGKDGAVMTRRLTPTSDAAPAAPPAPVATRGATVPAPAGETTDTVRNPLKTAPPSSALTPAAQPGAKPGNALPATPWLQRHRRPASPTRPADQNRCKRCEAL